jgi:hypothetical protein
MRAVFWLGKGEDANEKGVTRFSVVLEFNVPSIGPGKAGYRPFAQAWKDMTTMTSTEQAQRLAALFFTGLNNMPAIATADNLGLNGGQLRSNSLAPDADHSGPSWIMRESAVALQGTPNVQLRSLPGSIDPAIFKGNSPLTTEFIQAVTKILASVTVPDRAAQASGTTVTIGEFAALGLNKAEIPDKFQPMQQIGVRPDFDISQFAPPEISISITAAAKASGLPMNGHIAGNRISAGSCFGCHFPNKQALGATNFSFNTLNAMLDSNGFTQIDQDRKFSPFTLNALKVRNEFLENFLRDTAPVTAAAMLR